MTTNKNNYIDPGFWVSVAMLVAFLALLVKCN